jgi:hypothetical protein
MPRSSWDTYQAAKRIRVSLYERVGSILLSLLIFMGAVVTVLVLIWWTNKNFGSQTAVPVTLVEDFEGEGGGDGRASGGTQLEEPNPTDAPSTPEPTTLDEMDNSMDSIDSLVVEQAAMLEDPNMESRPRPRGDYGTGGGSGGGSGPGKGLGFGPGKPGRPRRWEIRFASEHSLATYARQLQFFKIELGVLQPGNKVIYVFNLDQPVPQKREGPADQEKRYYLTWRSGELQKADIELFSKAGVDPGEHIILKFLPPEVEQKLIDLEKARAGNRIKQIQKTIFGIQSAGDGYAFNIIEQTYNQ